MSELQTLLLKQRPALRLSSRQLILDELLRFFLEVQETLWSSEGYDAGEETGIQTTIFASSPSYQALDRLLKHLRAQNKGLYWHLSEWYFRAQRFPSYAASSTVRYRSHGTLYEEQRSRPANEFWVNTIRHPSAHASQVKAALDWLDSEWESRGLGEPFVPDEILEAHLPGDHVLRARSAA